jgi:hypothetical protein
VISDPAVLLVSSIFGLALGATAALLRAVLPRWIPLTTITLFAIVPLAVVGRTQLAHAAGRTLWEWSAVGGATVQAAYHVDPLAVTAAAAISLGTGAALSAAARASALLPALLATLGIALVALVAVTDIVVAAIVAGTAAAFAVAVGLFVAPQAAAARLAALLAIGVESFIAAALLLARAGVASFELDDIAPAALSSEAMLPIVFGAALFGGLYPFIPWRYDRAAGEAPTPLMPLRGLSLFPTGLAGSVLAFRFLAASGQRPDQLRLPAVSIEAHAALLAVVLVLGAFAVRAAPRDAIPRRAITSLVFVLAALVLPFLSVSHVMALAALLTIVYATVASTALVEEWGVARFAVRLAVLWAAVASGSAPALAGALFGMVASSIALVFESITLRGAVGGALAASASLLNLLGPFLALAGVAFAPDPIAGALAGLVLAGAALLELGHAVRLGAGGSIAERAFAALVAVAVVFVVALVASIPATSAAVAVLGPLPAEALDLVLLALTLLAIALSVAIVALPGTVRGRLGGRGVALLRRVLAASDPVPALALAYRGLEAWSERIGSSFASFEDRAGVWLATALLALALVWAATS